MHRNFASAVAMGAAAVLATAAAAVLTCSTARAGDITVEQVPFLGTLSRDEVKAELRKPYIGGNPWSARYDMFQQRSTTTREQVTDAYTTARDEVRALHAEDSGAAYFLKSAAPARPDPRAAMGGPAR